MGSRIQTFKVRSCLDAMAKIWKKFRALNPLVKGFLAFFVLTFGFAFLFAPELKPVNYEEVSFQTTSDSRLYFNNVRSFFYRIDRFSKAPMEIYRLKRRSGSRDSSNLNFAIAHYPGADQAFIVAELGADYRHCDSLILRFEAYPGVESLELMDGEQQFKIAAKVYSSLLEEQRIFLCCGSDTLKQLYVDKAEELDAEVALEDYFKLTLKN